MAGRAAVHLAQPPHFEFTARVVHRDVRGGLDEAHLADAVAADPAGRQVGDAAAGELQPGVGDVDAAGQHRHADGFDADDLLVDHREQHVEVVNHQVEDDVDVEAAVGERAEPVHLDESRAGEERPARHRRPD